MAKILFRIIEYIFNELLHFLIKKESHSVGLGVWFSLENIPHVEVSKAVSLNGP